MSQARQAFFDAKNNKPRKEDKKWYKFGFGGNEKKYQEDLVKYERDVEKAEKEYSGFKNEYTKELLSEGKKEDVQKFLLSEVESKRKNNLENGPLGARMIKGISNGIKWWEEIGNNPDDSKTKQFWKKRLKEAAAVAIIAGASAAVVSAFASAGVGTAAAISGSYFARKMGMSVGFSSVMTVMPDSFKPFASKIMAGVSMASMAGVAGYGASKLSSWATKKWWSEKAIGEKSEEKMSGLKINVDTLETDLKKYEEECEKIIKEAERKRVYRRLLAGTTALGTSIAFLEVAGVKTEEAEIKHQTEMKHEAQVKAEIKHQAEIKHNTELKHQAEVKTQAIEQKSVHEFMKTNSTQEAIKLGLYKPGSAHESAFAEKGTMSFDDGKGHHVEVPLSSRGAIDTIHNLQEKILKTYGRDANKVPAGHINMHYTDMKGVDHDQVLIKGEHVEQFQGTMGHGTIIENQKVEDINSTNTENLQNQNTGEQTDLSSVETKPVHLENDHHTIQDGMTDQPAHVINHSGENNIPSEEKSVNVPAEHKEPTGPVYSEMGKTGNGETTGDAGNHQPTEHKIETSSENSYAPMLSSEQLAHIDHMHDNAINHVFPTREAHTQWDNIKNSSGLAATILHEPKVDVKYQGLQELIKEIHDKTHIEPKENGGLVIGTTLDDYIKEGAKYAETHNIKIKNLNY